MRFTEFKDSDYEIHDRPKLDKILLELCHRVIQGKQNDPMKYGMVAACVLDPKNRKVFGINEAAKDGTRRHAERVAMDRYEQHYGPIPEGSIILSTLSPCNEEDMDERYGESCTDLVNNSNCRKVYCGYIDPSQNEEHAEYTLEETDNKDIQRMCKKFADTFLKLDESWSQKYKKSINCKNPKGFSQRAHCQGRAKEEDYDPVDPTFNVGENFADGRNPQDKGDSKRHGINTKASVSSLRKTAKQGGRKGQLAHWLANMKAGRAKKK